MVIFEKAKKFWIALMGKTQPYSLGEQVSASSTETEDLSIAGNGMIEGPVTLRIYPGPELALHINVWILDVEGNKKQKLVIPHGKSYIDGDDDTYRWDISKEVYEGQTIRVEAENTDGTNAYDWRLNFSINYSGIFGGNF